MKIQRFLDELIKTIQERPDIHLPTLKLIIKSFYFHLSEKQKARWLYQVNVITSFTSIQQTIDSNIQMNNIKNLEKELQRVKKQ